MAAPPPDPSSPAPSPAPSLTPTPRAPLTVGVLGGMGPEATLDFFARLLAATPAARDQDHLHLLIDCNPRVPDRNAAVAGLGPSPAAELRAMAARLEAAGAELLVMPCNAAHAFAAAVREGSSRPFASIVEETVAAVVARAPAPRCVGVLASSGCLDAGLYAHAFAARGVEVREPEGAAREAFQELLYRIKGGDKGSEVRAGMRALAEELAARGAEALVAGCTEVPLVLGADEAPLPLWNSTDALVAATVAYARGERPLPRQPPEQTAGVPSMVETEDRER